MLPEWSAVTWFMFTMAMATFALMLYWPEMRAATKTIRGTGRTDDPLVDAPLEPSQSELSSVDAETKASVETVTTEIKSPCPRTATELFELVKGRTRVGEEIAIRPYIGTWMEFTGKVQDVTKFGQSITVAVRCAEKLVVHFDFEEAAHDPYFGALREGDTIAARGELKRASFDNETNLGQLILKHAELAA